MKTFKIKDKVILVDDEDFDSVMKCAWYLTPKGYVWHKCHRWCNSLHRFILQKAIPFNCEVDHINQNKLDNRKCNLRIAEKCQNRHNRKPHINNISGYRGVSFHKQACKWRAFINHKGKHHHLGLFDDIIDAAKAYDKKALELLGDYVVVNFPVNEVLA